MDPTAYWLVLIWGVCALIALVAFLFFYFMLRGLVDRLIAAIDAMKVQVEEMDDELKPVIRDVQKMLADVEPLTKELGDRGREIGAILENLERVTNDAQATTGAIRTGVVPIAHSLAGLFAGVVEGSRALGEYTRRGRKDSEY